MFFDIKKSKDFLNDLIFTFTSEILTFWCFCSFEFEPFFLLEEPFTYFCLEKGKERKYGKFSYKADFLLKVEGLDKLVVWETKGRPKPDYMIRKKLWYKKYGDEYYFVQIHSSKQSKEIFDKYRGDNNEQN